MFSPCLFFVIFKGFPYCIARVLKIEVSTCLPVRRHLDKLPHRNPELSVFLLERTALFTAGGCGHCSLGSQFEDGLMVPVKVRGALCGFVHGNRLLQYRGDGLGEALVEEDGGVDVFCHQDFVRRRGLPSLPRETSEDVNNLPPGICQIFTTAAK